jgi:hypothetical protein
MNRRPVLTRSGSSVYGLRCFHMRVSASALLLVLVVAGVAGVTFPSTLAGAPAPIFQFESDEFWLNLHKFLYVLGRAENKYPDASREAVAGAPADADRGLASLTEAERKTWADAVSAYAQGLSRQDPLRDRDLALLEGSLADIDNARLVEGAPADASIRAVLERAAPVYRKAWWSSHRAANRAWVSATQQLLKTQGPTVLRFITRAYRLPWPAAGYPVHAVAYASWAGAYSTDGNLLVVSSNPAAGTSGWGGLETVFHESMHQWDDAVAMLLDAQARATGGQLPRNLSHAIVFFTAGEAVRHVAPAGYVPLADSTGVWQRGMTGLKAALEKVWLPYLNGRGTRDEALAALVRSTAVAPPASHIFSFKTDDFWLNLHHFLYALGLVEAKSPDASQPALAPAGPDMQRGLQRLDADERRKWAEVVTRYATGWSQKTPTAEPTAHIVRTLAAAGDAPTLATVNIDPALRTALEQAAPLYRTVWWTTHRDGNRAWQSLIEPLIARYGDLVRNYLTRAYAIEWPTAGRLVRVTAYTTFAGAYSLVNGGLIVVSSVDPASQGLSGLEAVFHEALHQWDPQTFGALGEQAKKINVTVPRDLPHAMIFFTAGEAVRRVAPEYVPTVERLGIWQLNLSGASLPASRLKQPLLDTWKPYLDGRGTRDAALAALLTQAAAASSR